MKDKGTLIFKRPAWKNAVIAVTVLIMISFTAWLGVYLIFFYRQQSTLTLDLFCALAVILSPMWVLTIIYTADIHVDDDGISWWKWGKRLRYIQWTDVKTMAIETIIVRNYIPRFLTSYVLYTTESQSWWNSQRHGMRFDDDIPNAPKLVEAVRLHLEKINAAIVDKRDDRSKSQ